MLVFYYNSVLAISESTSCNECYLGLVGPSGAGLGTYLGPGNARGLTSLVGKVAIDGGADCDCAGRLGVPLP